MSITLALSKEPMDADGKEASYSCCTPWRLARQLKELDH
jgi:hypothetical protein